MRLQILVVCLPSVLLTGCRENPQQEIREEIKALDVQFAQHLRDFFNAGLKDGMFTRLDETSSPPRLWVSPLFAKSVSPALREKTIGFIFDMVHEVPLSGRSKIPADKKLLIFDSETDKLIGTFDASGNLEWH
jgi:hypothetical protein